MLSDLLKTLTQEEQQMLFTQFADQDASLHSTLQHHSDAEQMTIAASPFVPTAAITEI